MHVIDTNLMLLFITNNIEMKLESSRIMATFQIRMLHSIVLMGLYSTVPSAIMTVLLHFKYTNEGS